MKKVTSFLLLLLLTTGYSCINAQCEFIAYSSSVEDFGCNSCGSIVFEATSYFNCPDFLDAIIRVEVPQGFTVDNTDSDFSFVETIGQSTTMKVLLIGFLIYFHQQYLEAVMIQMT